MDPLDRPIGYWLKLLHDRIETRFAEDLGAEGLRRRHWQVLNTLARQDAALADLSDRLAPFWTGEGPGLEAVLDDLRSRGWVTAADGAIRLSPEGRAARDRIAERVDTTRADLVRGLEPHAYADTVTNLARMTANLGG